MPYLLGKKPALYDARTLRLENYLPETVKLPPLPSTYDWNQHISHWTMMGNDQFGDCVVAGAGHMVQRWTSNSGKEQIISDQTIVNTYLQLTGGVDSGLYLLDFLKFWHNKGLAGTKIGAYLQVSPKNITTMRYAAYLFGGVYLGIMLPLSAQDQMNAGQPWDVPPGGPVGEGEPGSWGGHCVASGKYTAAGYSLDTWGMQISATNAFIGQYCDEAWVIMTLDWFEADHKTPLEMDWSTLLKDQKLISH